MSRGRPPGLTKCKTCHRYHAGPCQCEVCDTRKAHRQVRSYPQLIGPPATLCEACACEGPYVKSEEAPLLDLTLIEPHLQPGRPFQPFPLAASSNVRELTALIRWLPALGERIRQEAR